MADIEMFSVTPSDDTHTGDTDFTDVAGATIAQLPKASFTASKKYLIIVSAATTYDDSSAAVFGLRVTHGDTPTEFANSRFLSSVDATNAYYTYFWFTVFDQPSTAEDIDLQHSTIADLNDTVDTRQISMTAIRLDEDLTENTDWFSGTNNVQTLLTDIDDPAYLDKAAVTFTPNGTDDWLVMMHGRHIPGGGAGDRFHMRIDLNDGDDVSPECITESEETNEEKHMGMFKVYTPSNEEKTWTSQHGSKAPNTGDNHETSEIFALKLNKFEDHGFQFTEAQVDLSATDFATEVATAGVKPGATSGDVLAMGFFVSDVQVDNLTQNRRVQEGDSDSSEIPVGVTAAALDQWRVHGSNTEIPMSVAGHYTGLSNAEKTFDMDGSTSAAAAGTSAEDRCIVMLTRELAAAAGGPAGGKAGLIAMLRQRRWPGVPCL